jgi:hypothetical protein
MDAVCAIWAERNGKSSLKPKLAGVPFSAIWANVEVVIVVITEKISNTFNKYEYRFIFNDFYLGASNKTLTLIFQREEAHQTL